MLAYAYLMAGESRWAKDVAERGLTRWPENVRLLSLLGDAQGRLGDNAAAIRAYRRATERERGNADALTRLGIAEKLGGNFDAAAVTLERAYALAPADPLIATALGETYLRMHDYPNAVRFCQEAVAIDPFRAQAHFFLAVSLAWLGRHVEGRDHARRAVELEPRNDEFRTLLQNAERVVAFSDAWEEQREAMRRGEPLRMLVSNVRESPTGLWVRGRLESGFPRTGRPIAIETPDGATIHVRLTGVAVDARPPEMVVSLADVSASALTPGSRVRELDRPP